MMHYKLPFLVTKSLLKVAKLSKVQTVQLLLLVNKEQAALFNIFHIVFNLKFSALYLVITNYFNLKSD